MQTALFSALFFVHTVLHCHLWRTEGEQIAHMFKGIGLLISLWAISLFFGSSMSALNSAATETFKAVELSALITQTQLETLSE